MLSFATLVRVNIGIPECLMIDQALPINTTQRIQESTFRLLQGSMYRVWQDAGWCHEHNTPAGRYYNWTDVRSMMLDLLDLEMLLQVDIDCQSKLMDLRQLIWNTSLLPSKDSTWWRQTWYETSLEAFSCGFTPPTDFSLIPNDLQTSIMNNTLLQKTWRLAEDFIWSSHKMKEYPLETRRLRYSHYIPFIDLHSCL